MSDKISTVLACTFGAGIYGTMLGGWYIVIFMVIGFLFGLYAVRNYK